MKARATSESRERDPGDLGERASPLARADLDRKRAARRNRDIRGKFIGKPFSPGVTISGVRHEYVAR
jgi:hypothetical protein